MNQTTSVQEIGTQEEAREQLKLQLAQYLEGQPESTQSIHRWMKRLEVAGVGIIVATFSVALYVSIAWKSVNPIVIPIAWFVFAASVAPAMIFLGLDAIILRAFPPVVLPGKLSKFVTGSGAVWAGSVFILLALVVAAFWGFFAYTVGTFNLAMIGPLTNILGVAVGVLAIVSVLKSLYQKIARTR